MRRHDHQWTILSGLLSAARRVPAVAGHTVWLEPVDGRYASLLLESSSLQDKIRGELELSDAAIAFAPSEWSLSEETTGLLHGVFVAVAGSQGLILVAD